MSASTYVAGLNAALQKRFVLPSDTTLMPGNVHRASHISTGVGGKGQDVACTLHCLEYNYRSNNSFQKGGGELKLAQFIGRNAQGDQVYSLLEEMLGADVVKATTVRTESGMRTCTSIVAADSTTELVEPSGTVTAQERAELLEKLRAETSDAKASALCIMGSLPPGCADDTYAEIYVAVADERTLCLIDSVAGLDPLLRITAATGGPTLLKINAAELCRLVGLTTSSTTSETAGVPCDQVVNAVQEFLKKLHQHESAGALTAIAVTDGKHPAYMALLSSNTTTAFQLYRLPVATLPRDTVLYPIGAGDSVAAGTLAAWQYLLGQEADCLPPNVRTALDQNKPEEESSIYLTAFAFGLACGSASCLQEENSVVQIPDVLRLFTTTEQPTLVSSHTVRSPTYT